MNTINRYILTNYLDFENSAYALHTFTLKQKDTAMKSILGIGLVIAAFASNGQEFGVLSPEKTEQEILTVTKVLYSEEILDSLVEEMVNNSNLLHAIDQEVQMFDEEILQKKRSWVSSFRLGVNLFSANTTLDQENQSLTTYGVLPNVGLNLTIDPEKLVNRKSYVRQSTNKREYHYYMLEDSKRTLKKDILNHYFDYLALLESVNIRHHALEGRKQQRAYVEGSFRNGESTYNQLLIAENQVHLATEALMKASLDAMKKKSEISVLIGLK